MHTLELGDILEAIPLAIKEGRYRDADAYLWPALDQRSQNAALWFYAGVLSSLQGRNALSIQCFLKSQELDPQAGQWSNLGGVIRSIDVDLGRKILEIGNDHYPNDGHIMANLCGSYVNEGNPWPGIEYGEKCLGMGGGEKEAKFNLALLYLEAGVFDKGFDLYAEGYHRLREVKSYNPDPPMLTHELHEQLKGKGKKIIVYGEQGIGDELMFSTMFREMKKDYHIVFDCHPRLESLYRSSSWFHSEGHPITLYATRKTDEKNWSVEADAKSSIGNMARFYRRKREDFHWTGPVYKADEAETADYRSRLLRVANGRKIIGIAMNGGTMSTARTYRSMHPDLLKDLLSDDRYLFVGLDYEDMTGHGVHISQTYGEGKYLWYPSIAWAWDYKHQAALIAATDAVVTVCQSAAHLSAAMGHPTYVMTPSKPAWRYGVKGDWAWYPSPNARLLRQIGEDWGPASSALKEALQARFFEKAA